MPSQTRKSLREVYANACSALTLTPVDFGLAVCEKTGRLIQLKGCKKEESKNEAV